MSCLKGNDCRKAVLAYSLVLTIQTSLAVTTVVLGVKGHASNHGDTADKSGSPYYVGALVCGSVFCLTSVLEIAMVIGNVCNSDHSASECFTLCSCICMFVAIPAVFVGLVFLIAFGIADCKKDDDGNTGTSCSYSANIEDNYRIAALCLTFVIILLFTNFCVLYVFCKWNEALDSRSLSGDDPNDYGNNRVEPSVYSVQNESAASSSGHYSGKSSSNSSIVKFSLKKLRERREREQDYNRQRRLGVPEHKLVRKFIK